MIRRYRHPGDERVCAEINAGRHGPRPLDAGGRRALPPEFYARPTLDVARDLIGKVLVHDAVEGTVSGVIVEVEAYIGESDPACHAAPGWTPRNAPLYGPPGRAYVYLNYGIHQLVNAVTEPQGAPAAVLLRAVQPLEGVALMRRRRGLRPSDRRERAEVELCRGPGNLSQAFGISLAQNRALLDRGRLRIEVPVVPRGELGGRDVVAPVAPVEWTPRIGIRVGTEHRWRCAVVGSEYVTACRDRGTQRL